MSESREKNNNNGLVHAVITTLLCCLQEFVRSWITSVNVPVRYIGFVRHRSIALRPLRTAIDSVRQREITIPAQS